MVDIFGADERVGMFDILGTDDAETAGEPTRIVGGAVTPAGLGMLNPVPMGRAMRGAPEANEGAFGVTGLVKCTPPTPGLGLPGETNAPGFGVVKEPVPKPLGPTPGAGMVEAPGLGKMCGP